MTYYRSHPLDLSTRITLATEMLLPCPERPWGHVTYLSSQYGVSRTWLYKLRHRALEAVCAAVHPRRPGPAPAAASVRINRPFVQRAITVLPLLKGTVRGIQEGLDLLFGVKRSVGHISETLQRAGDVAAEMNAAVTIPSPVLAEADEIFQGQHPCLTVVDGRSFVVLNLKAEAQRDATTWGVTFLSLQEQGIRMHDLVSDGAKGIRSGIKETQLTIPLRLDFFHLLREAHTVAQRLQRIAYRAMEAAEKARRAEAQARHPARRAGRPLSVFLPRREALAQEQQAIETYDLFVWLVREVQGAAQPITATGQLATTAETVATMQTAATLIRELRDPKAQAFAHKLSLPLQELAAPVSWLETYLAPFRTGLDSETERLILWAWSHRDDLALSLGEGFPEELKPMVCAFWHALSLFHRTSSLAECLHSWLRPYLVMHRGMPKWLLSLLQLYWNHREFQRGKRAGKSPLEIAGVEKTPSLNEVLQRLFHSDPLAAQPTF